MDAEAAGVVLREQQSEGESLRRRGDARRRDRGSVHLQREGGGYRPLSQPTGTAAGVAPPASAAVDGMGERSRGGRRRGGVIPFHDQRPSSSVPLTQQTM